MVSKFATQVAKQPVPASRYITKEHQAQQIISAFDNLAKSGLLNTCAGDISVRLPGTNTILITPHMPFVEKLTASDFLELTTEGHIIGKRGHPNFLQWMHLAVYRIRPDVRAIVHSQAPMVTVIGICQLPIPPITVDTVPFMSLPRIPAKDLPNNKWAQTVAEQLAGGAPAALLVNHGSVTVGANLQQAVRRAIALEDTARILVICYLLHQVPDVLPPEAVQVLKNALPVG